MPEFNKLLTKYRPKVFEEVAGQEDAVRKLTNMIVKKAIPAGVLLSGIWGLGKTTLAKLVARALICEKGLPTSFNPCNDCIACNGMPIGGLFIERNCASLTTEQLQRDLISYVAFKIVYYDELHRAKIPLQEMLLKALEGDPWPLNIFFIFSTFDLERVEGALIKRVTHIKLIPPTVEQVIPWLEKICNLESIPIEDRSALGLIAEDCKCIPRDCLNFLFDHCVLLDQPVSKKIVGRVETIDAIGREKVTSRTKF